jgi:hypothetical protein
MIVMYDLTFYLTFDPILHNVLLQSKDLESKLRDTTWRLQQLQTQYDYLASKLAAQASTYKTSESQLEVKK